MVFLFYDKISDEERFIIKSSAYSAIDKYNISSLPVTLDTICKNNLFNLTSIQRLSFMTGTPVDEYLSTCGGYGYLYYSSDRDRYFIFYNEDLGPKLSMWTIIFLIAEIELNYVYPDRITYLSLDDLYLQTFASYFAAPDPILCECDITSPYNIVNTCNLPVKNAVCKSRILKKHFPSTALDEHLKFKFSKYIDSYKKEKPPSAPTPDGFHR